MAVLLGIKLAACPHCRRSGALIGHGFLRGYAECSSEQVVRGRRFFCSDRSLRFGCGRTFSVALMTMLGGFVVRTLTLLCFAQAVLGGLTRRAAWLRGASCWGPPSHRNLGLIPAEVTSARGALNTATIRLSRKRSDARILIEL